VRQDLIGRLLERKPARRLGMLNGRANDIKKHKWFEGLDWEALEARKVTPLRKPKEDSAKRLKELTVRSPAADMLSLFACLPGYQVPSSIRMLVVMNDDIGAWHKCKLLLMRAYLHEVCTQGRQSKGPVYLEYVGVACSSISDHI